MARSNRAPAPEPAPEIPTEPQPERPRNPTIGDNFIASAALIVGARRDTKLSEATLLKLYELNLMWALNNRASVSPNVYDDPAIDPPEEGEEEPGEAVDLPDANENITAAEEA